MGKVKRILFLADSNAGGTYNAMFGLAGMERVAPPEWEGVLDIMWGSPSRYGVDQTVKRIAAGERYDAVYTAYSAGDVIGAYGQVSYNGQPVMRSDTVPSLVQIHAHWAAVGVPVLIGVTGGVNPITSGSWQVKDLAEKVDAHYFYVWTALRSNACPAPHPPLKALLRLPTFWPARYWPDAKLEDWVHFSPAGYHAMAKRVLPKLKAFL